MVIKRKEFLQLGSLATVSFMVPKFLKAFEGVDRVPPGNKVMVILQLSGGNDGLNTVIPIRNDIYYRERPGLGIDQTKALALTDEVGLHSALITLKELYDDGSLGILNNVGYPNPDRSHFRGMDIWQTGSASNEYITTGWVGRYLDAQCGGCDKPNYALEIDDVLSLALKVEYRLKTIATFIYSDINTKFYYISLDSFDNHVNQENQQQRLFTELSNALKAFTADLKNNNRFNDVLMFTFSEFGRRVSQNASGGTDHGTANNMFLIGRALKQKGIINSMPDLDDLEEGDLKYKIDFKTVYATVVRNWLDADDTAILCKKYD